jgi:hypothetical protein
MNHIQDLIDCYKNSPYPSTKLTTYFSAYAELFSHLRNSDSVFIETGVLGGGSLHMWRNWFGPKARIIGIDLNPEALKWKEQGFEIFIGDQGDPNFWQKILKSIGQYDALLDDGGHQSFQQIVTLIESIRYASDKCIIAIEDTHTSFMNDFKSHGNHTFLNYAKSSTDFLTIKGSPMYPNRMSHAINTELLDLYKNIHSIQFFNSLVAYKIDKKLAFTPSSIWNHKNTSRPSDFRYEGKASAKVLWPNTFTNEFLVVKGGKSD